MSEPAAAEREDDGRREHDGIEHDGRREHDGAEHDGRREHGGAEHDGDDEHEPDYRFTLANERTFLAWLRTSLSLLAGGVAVVQLVPAFTIPFARSATGGLLAALAVLTAAAGLLRWRGVEYAIRRGRPLPAQRVPWVLAAGLVLLALFGLVLIVLRGAS